MASPSVQAISGIHHITAIAGDAQTNLDFYAGALGLRLVKRTVNFDDPGTYHLYYGDAKGRPGTILTFFPWAQATTGLAGSGMAGATAFAAPQGTFGFWMDRLEAHGIATSELAERFGRQVLRLADPHGLPLEIVFRSGLEAEEGWEGSPVPPECALRHFDGVTLDVSSTLPVARLFREVFEWNEAGTDNGRTRFEAPGAGARGAAVDLVDSAQRARPGAGTVHHVAFRAADNEAQARWRERLIEHGLSATGVKDRQYFRSIYFRDRQHTGGVLFEIATDPPGFLTDESEGALGTALKLPPWLEGRREAIEAQLPTLADPAG